MIHFSSIRSGWWISSDLKANVSTALICEMIQVQGHPLPIGSGADQRPYFIIYNLSEGQELAARLCPPMADSARAALDRPVCVFLSCFHCKADADAEASGGTRVTVNGTLVFKLGGGRRGEG